LKETGHSCPEELPVDSVIDATYPRQFVPANADMGEWTQIEPLFDALDARTIENLKQFEQWILDGSELAACLSEEYNNRYVAMTCQTDDSIREKAYLHFVEEIQPRCKPRWRRTSRSRPRRPSSTSSTRRSVPR
jgi:hypothetical protein